MDKSEHFIPLQGFWTSADKEFQFAGQFFVDDTAKSVTSQWFDHQNKIKPWFGLAVINADSVQIANGIIVHESMFVRILLQDPYFAPSVIVLSWMIIVLYTKKRI